MYADASTDALYELFRIPKSALWVAKDNEENILGCCGIYPTEGLPADCTELVKFYLHENARGKGIGKALLQQSIQSARQLGYSQVYLETLPEFGTALGIYDQEGFLPLSAPMGNSGHNNCTVWMEKKL